jgi:hypothetical protein
LTLSLTLFVAAQGDEMHDFALALDAAAHGEHAG